MIDNAAAEHVIRKASKLLLVWSPWWQKAVNNSTFLYKDNVPGGITGLSDYLIIVDKQYLFDNRLMDIAIRLEFALQQASRGMDVRFKNMRSKYPHIDKSLIGLAQSIEINSDIEQKFQFFDRSTWDLLVRRDIDKSYIYEFDAQDPPRLPDSSWTSKKLGLPDNRRAEVYLDMLVEQSEQHEQDWLDNKDKNQHEEQQDKQQESQQDNQQEESQQEEQQDNVNTPHQDSQQDEQVEGMNSGDSSDGDGTDNNDYDTSGDSITGESIDTANTDITTDNASRYDDYQEEFHDDSDIDNQTEEYTGTTDSNNSGQGDSLDDVDNTTPAEDHADSPVDDHDDYSSVDTSGGNQYDNTYGDSTYESDTEAVDAPQFDDLQKTGADYDSTSYNSSPLEKGTDYTEDDLQEFQQALHDDIQQSDKDVIDAIQDEKNDIQGGEYHSLIDDIKSQSEDNGLLELSTPERPYDDDLIGLNEDEKKQVEKEIADDIKDFQKSFNLPGKSSAPVSEHYTEWSKKRLKKPKANWKKRFPKMIQPLMSQGIMNGKMDMSYSKRNPNQKDGPNEPILQGWVSYPPEVAVLIDSSPSMMKFKDTTIRELMGLLRSIFTKYAQPVSIFLADSGINFCTKSMSPYSAVMKNLGRTYHGTSAQFGDTLLMMLKKRNFKAKGNFFNRADILVVFTDCLFYWPLMDRTSLPKSYPDVLIISVKPYDEVKEVLPPWVKEKKNFIYADE